MKGKEFLKGTTYRISTPMGTAFITVNVVGSDPVEVFVNIGKAGSDVTAFSEALGRLISMILQMECNIQPDDRIAMIIDQLGGIGGSRSIGFGPNRVRSVPDAVAKVLKEYVSEGQLQHDEIGDLCPECGAAAYVNMEGCKRCQVCGYSEC